jgi:hypothetical protein
MESYLTQPNMYARGILFGKMKYELGDHSIVKCPELGLVADLEFKTKGWVGGTYNAIGGTVKNEHTGEVLYELSGFWNEEMFLKDLKARTPWTLPAGIETNQYQDRPQRDVLQRAQVKTQLAICKTTCGAGGKGVAKTMGQDNAGSQRSKSRGRY